MKKLSNKVIADRLRDYWSKGMYVSVPATLSRSTIQFDIDGFIVRCRNDHDAVMNVAHKFDKGLPRGFTVVVGGRNSNNGPRSRGPTTEE
tara:strand:- start:1084 stop:1353 length:270 start_codon:yes stop_codon:yes gene_type:complete